MNVDLEKWLEKLKMDREKIDENITHIEALLKIFKPEKFTNNDIQHYITKPTSITKKINQGHEIYNICKNMVQEFSSGDIKQILEQSEDERIKKISSAYISHSLGTLARKGILTLVRSGAGKGSPNYFIFNRGSDIAQIEKQ